MNQEDIAFFKATSPVSVGEVADKLYEEGIDSFATPMYNTVRKGYSTIDRSRGWQVMGYYGNDFVDVQFENISVDKAIEVVKIINDYFQESR